MYSGGRTDDVLVLAVDDQPGWTVPSAVKALKQEGAVFVLCDMWSSYKANKNIKKTPTRRPSAAVDRYYYHTSVKGVCVPCNN